MNNVQVRPHVYSQATNQITYKQQLQTLSVLAYCPYFILGRVQVPNMRSARAHL